MPLNLTFSSLVILLSISSTLSSTNSPYISCGKQLKAPRSLCKCSSNLSGYELTCGPGLKLSTDTAGKEVEIMCVPPNFRDVYIEEEDISWDQPSSLPENLPSPLKHLQQIRIAPVDRLTACYCNFSDSDYDIAELLRQAKPTQFKLTGNQFRGGHFDLDMTQNGDDELLERITSLNLEKNELVDLPMKLLVKMSNLQELVLNVNNLTALYGPFNDKLRVLDIASNHIDYIHPDAFKGLESLQTLHLWTNKISVLNANVFKDFKNLTSLELMANQLETLDGDIFETLEKLQSINLSGNLFKDLPERLFWNNPDLASLRLERNNLDNLPNYMFWNTSKLTSIRLNDNNLTTLDNETFYGLRNVTNIDLHNNKLNYISKELFSNMINLTKLSLRGNKIEEIDADAFVELEKLEELDLSYNQLARLEDFVFRKQSNLKKLNLAHNHITIQEFSGVTPINLIINIEELDFTENNLTYIPDDFVSSKTKLKKLFLAFNQFTSLEFLSLQSISSYDVYVDLSNNQITRILEMSEVETTIVQDSKMYKGHRGTNIKINLENNPLDCDCANYDLFRYVKLEMDPLFRERYEIMGSLMCAAPEGLIGAKFGDIDPSMMSYEVPTCPTSCDCYNRPFDNRLIIDCSARNLTTVPALFIPEDENVRQRRLTCRPRKNASKVVIVQVILKENRIVHLPPTSFGNISVTFLDVSFNNLADLSWIPSGLKDFKLDHNDLKRMNKSVLELLHMRNVNATFDGNPWICDCETVPFWMYLNDRRIPNKEAIQCMGTGKTIRVLSRDSLCPSYARLIAILSVIGALIIIIPSIALVLFYRYNQEIKVWLFAHNTCLWFVREEDLDKDKIYDAFVSFSQLDEDFVVKELLPKLEDVPNPYKLCIHMRNWIPGEFVAKQVADSVLNSRRTIVVLSPAFLESVWGKMEFRAAHTKAISEGVARVIVILFNDLDPNDEKIDEELRVYLKTNTYIKWGDPWFWDKLKYALPHRKCHNAAYVNKRFESISANLDKLDKFNQNISVNVGNPNVVPTIDPLLLKGNPLDFKTRCVDTPPAEKGMEV